MKSAMRLAALALAGALLLFSAGAEGGPDENRIAIVYTGAAFGKLKPCACSPETDLGGVLRRDTALAKLKAEHPDALVLDAGSSFKEPTVQGKLGAKAYIDTLRALGYDAAAIGPGDLIFGREFLEETGGSLVFVSNLRWKGTPSRLTVPLRRIPAGEIPVEVIAIVDPSDVYTGSQSEIEAEDPAAFFDRTCRKGEPTVVLCSTSDQTARRLLAHPEVEVVINALARKNIQDEPRYEFQNGKVLAEGSLYGSRIGVLQLKWEGSKIVAASNRFVPLDKQVADGERARPFHESYEAQVKELFLKSLAGKPAFDKEKSPYLGSEGCASCHEKTYDTWKASRHAGAWESLREVNKTFDPECIACHVIGMGKEGGFVSEQDSPHLVDVGCEACHGPGKAHAAAGGGALPKFTLKGCTACHNSERSPAFMPEQAWEKIRHE